VAELHPYPGLELAIGPGRYAFVSHPLFPADVEEVYAIEGGEAVVYQVQDLTSGTLWALKVSKPSYRGVDIARSVAALAAHAALPGLHLGNRACLTKAAYPELIATYPALEYAVLMPWLSGRTWAGLLLDRTAAERTYGMAQALDLALATAHVLWDLEAHHMAHTDIAGTNVVLAPDLRCVELLDLEHLYLPEGPAPTQRIGGTPGYQHRNLGVRGQWCAEGDRFAGAILLTEMLTWWDPEVRGLTPEGAESLFLPGELQEIGGARWQMVRDALWTTCAPALDLFDHAWASYDLAHCPELSAWALCLIQSRL
jgi:hypothetical protein